MKLKKKYLAVIVALMVVMTAVVASLIVSSVQGSRIAYVAVSADKEIYSVGEVTFKLRPLSQGVDFTIGGGYGDPNTGSYYGEVVSIIRIPDDVDPYSIIDDRSMLNNMYGWRSHNSVSLPIPEFSSSGESLSMSWNGTIKTYDRDSSGYVWGQATAGYYLLYPEYYSHSYGERAVKFFLDHSSIFYYDSLDVDYEIVTEGQGTKVTMNLTLPNDDASIVEGILSAFVPSGVLPGSSPYYNFTLDLRPGETSTVTINVPSADPMLSLDAVLTTPSGRYIFGFYSSYHYDNQGGMTSVIYTY